MRSIFVFMVLLSLVVLPCVGCDGGGAEESDVPDAQLPTDPNDPTMAGPLPEDGIDAPAEGGAEPATE